MRVEGGVGHSPTPPLGGGGGTGFKREASPQGNCDAGYLGACTAGGQGVEAHPGLFFGVPAGKRMPRLGCRGKAPLALGGRGGAPPVLVGCQLRGVKAPLLVL